MFPSQWHKSSLLHHKALSNSSPVHENRKNNSRDMNSMLELAEGGTFSSLETYFEGLTPNEKIQAFSLQNSQGKTLLHYAVEHENHTSFHYLLFKTMELSALASYKIQETIEKSFIFSVKTNKKQFVENFLKYNSKLLSYNVLKNEICDGTLNLFYPYMSLKQMSQLDNILKEKKQILPSFHIQEAQKQLLEKIEQYILIKAQSFLDENNEESKKEPGPNQDRNFEIDFDQIFKEGDEKMENFLFETATLAKIDSRLNDE